MTLVAFGINYKTASLPVREQVAQSLKNPLCIANKIRSKWPDSAFLSVATCNRIELYLSIPHEHLTIHAFTDIFPLCTDTLTQQSYLYTDHNAIRHLLHVAVGLDSMMLGEPQILGQLKHAYHEAELNDHLNPSLRSIFSFIFNESKKIRHQSGINQHPISIASAASKLLYQNGSSLKTRQALLIGTGEMATLMAKYLQSDNHIQWFVASKTRDRTTPLVTRLSATPLTITEIPSYLQDMDIIISATTCPMPFIHAPMIKEALRHRLDRPLLILDLAVPRNVASNVGGLPQVSLFNIDDLHATIESGRQKREEAAQYATQLIEHALLNLQQQEKILSAKNLICDYRKHMQYLAQGELARAKKKLHNGASEDDVMSELCDRLVNKLTHLPTLKLKQAASQDHQALLDLADYLFNPSLGDASHEKIS